MHTCAKIMTSENDHLNLLVNIARAYYEHGLTQEEIAQSLPISRSQVSRYLTEARELGIVQFRVINPRDRIEVLGAQLLTRFTSLKTAIVVPLLSQDDTVARQSVGIACASYLRQALHSGQRLCIGCGRTVRNAIEALKLHPLPNLSVVQAMGNLGHEALDIDFNALVRSAADAFGARAYYINAPAILGSGSAAELESANVSIRDSLEQARTADIYLVSVGLLDRDQLYARSGLISQAEIRWLQEQHVAGDICGRFFDAEGHECDTPFASRIVGISLQDLERAHLSIGVVGGVEKARSLRAALLRGCFNVVVTDEYTAHAVLQLNGKGLESKANFNGQKGG